MASTSLIDNSTSLPQSVHDEYERKLLEKVDNNQRSGEKSFLDTLEEVRLEQRTRLANVEHDYYNQQKRERVITSKPPLPIASSSELATEQRARHRHAMSSSAVRRHGEEIAFCPHRTGSVNDLATDQVRRQIKSIWNEFGLEEYSERRDRPTTAASWAGRITVPEPFALTNSMDMENIHRRTCIPKFEAAKLRKAVEEELSVHHSFKGNSLWLMSTQDDLLSFFGSEFCTCACSRSYL